MEVLIGHNNSKGMIVVVEVLIATFGVHHREKGPDCLASTLMLVVFGYFIYRCMDS